MNMSNIVVLLILCLAWQVNSIRVTVNTDENKSQVDKLLASNCLDFGNSSEIQTLYLPGVGPFSALCESRFHGSGWTVIQRRFNGSVNFNRSWVEYRNGFGDIRGEFFIGLEKLYKMTSMQPYELLIYVRSFSLYSQYFKYSHFAVGSEKEMYALNQIKYDSSTHYYDGPMEQSMGQKFSTYDRDNDNYWFNNCAEEFKGGWWFDSCENTGFANLNGEYLFLQSINAAPFGSGIHWGKYREPPYKSVQMMIRPKSENSTST